MVFRLGDKVLMKKPHPCGSFEFVVIRTGADLKIKCLGCGRIIEGERFRLERKIKRVENYTENV